MWTVLLKSNVKTFLVQKYKCLNSACFNLPATWLSDLAASGSSLGSDFNLSLNLPLRGNFRTWGWAWTSTRTHSGKLIINYGKKTNKQQKNTEEKKHPSLGRFLHALGTACGPFVNAITESWPSVGLVGHQMGSCIKGCGPFMNWNGCPSITFVFVPIQRNARSKHHDPRLAWWAIKWGHV